MSKELEVAVKAAKEAGEVLKEHFRKASGVTIKEDRSFQTEADRLSEGKIISIIKEEFPDHSINAEESGFSKGDSKHTWLVDPLDGTTNYVIKIPLFSISITFVQDNKLKLGVVYDPINNELFTAVAGKKARLNDIPIEVSRTNDITKSLIGYSRPSSVKEKFVAIFPKVEKATRSPKILGSTALQLCYVADGRLDADISFSQRSWDIAAGILVIQEAGGKVTDFDGNDWSLEASSIVASNGKIHEELLDILND